MIDFWGKLSVITTICHQKLWQMVVLVGGRLGVYIKHVRFNSFFENYSGLAGLADYGGGGGK